MKASAFSDAQKVFILKRGADGVPVAEICRRPVISPATHFSWKKKYDGLLPPEMKRLKHLEDENGRQRNLVADLSLDRAMLQGVIRRKLWGLVASARWWTSVGAIGACRSGGLAGCWRWTRRAITTDPVAPTRPDSKPASRRSARRACAAAIAGCTCCCSARVGGSISRRPTVFITPCARSCVTRRQNGV